jgi:hypothetical protein
MSLGKPSVGQKRKRKTLSLHDKLSVIELFVINRIFIKTDNL